MNENNVSWNTGEMVKPASWSYASSDQVPFIVYEGTVARLERIIKRLVILVGITILLLFVSNAIWIYEWNQYDYSDVTVDSQDGGNAAYMGGSGVINNGEGGSQKAD